MNKQDRLVALDFETTGFHWGRGDRIIEIGCVEMINGKVTNNYFHTYLNPVTITYLDKEQQEVHGLTIDFLKDKPIFKDVVDDFLKFIGDSPIVIHNSIFDTMFLHQELQRINYKNISNKIIDTVEMARIYLPESKASLNHVCKYFGISLWNREKHGALTDAKLLAQAYPLLVLKSKKQTNLKHIFKAKASFPDPILRYTPQLVILTENDIKKHNNFCDKHGFHDISHLVK